MLPKKGLPPEFFDRIASAIPYSFNCSNPNRFSLLGKEFTIFRMDLQKEMRRSAINKVNEQNDNEFHLIQTILSQRHLFPCSLYFQPIVWEYDYTLDLFQFPHFLIIADRYSGQFYYPFGSAEKKNIHIINPGSFLKNFSFVVIYPQKGTVDLCQVPD